MVGTLLFFIAVLVTVAFVFLLYADSIDDPDVPLVDRLSAVTWVVAIALGVVAVLLLVLMLTRRMEKKTEAAEAAEVFFIPEEPVAPVAGLAAELTVYDLRKVPAVKRSWGAPENSGNRQTFFFPRTVEGGFFINDYIPIDATRTLKLRTLVGGPYDAAFAFEARRRAPAPAPQEAAPRLANTGRQALVLHEVQPEPAPAGATPEQTYFDYPGDIHEVEDLEGIGPVYGQKLREAGVHTTARLSYEDAAKLSEKLALPRRTIEQWKQMAELVKVKGIGPQYAEALVRSGVEGIAELKRRSAARIADQVNAYLSSLDTNVIGTKITEKRIEGWQDAAKPLRRVRLQVPEQ